MVVDEEQDLICHLAVPCDDKVAWKFKVTNDGALKVHDSIYSIVGASDHSLVANQAANDIVVHFRPEFFDHNIRPGSDYENDSAGHDYFRDRIADMTRYDMSSYERFYWTAQVSQDFFAKHVEDPEVVRDAQRAHKWNELASVMKATAQDAQDVCSFEQLWGMAQFHPVSRRFSSLISCGADQLHVVQGKVVLPLQSVVQHPDGDVATACIAFLTALLAAEPSVNHVAITPP